jgi:hypothetical protein
VWEQIKLAVALTNKIRAWYGLRRRKKYHVRYLEYTLQIPIVLKLYCKFKWWSLGNGITVRLKLFFKSH